MPARSSSPEDMVKHLRRHMASDVARIDQLKKENQVLRNVLEDWFDTKGNKRNSAWWHQWEDKALSAIGRK